MLSTKLNRKKLRNKVVSKLRKQKIKQFTDQSTKNRKVKLGVVDYENQEILKAIRASLNVVDSKVASKEAESKVVVSKKKESISSTKTDLQPQVKGVESKEVASKKKENLSSTKTASKPKTKEGKENK